MKGTLMRTNWATVWVGCCVLCGSVGVLGQAVKEEVTRTKDGQIKTRVVDLQKERAAAAKRREDQKKKELAAREALLKKAKPITAQTLTIEQIQEATRKGVEALYRMEPSYTFRSDAELRNALRRKYGLWRNRGDEQKIINMYGNQALACWALFAAGESYQNPRLIKRMNWVLSTDSGWVFDRGMRAQMLTLLPEQRWNMWVKRDAAWLTRAINPNGNFDDEYLGKTNDNFGDHANGQYGAIGLWALHDAGYPVADKLWGLIDGHWRSSQDKKSGGWAVGQVGSGTAQTREFEGSVNGPMTAGGVAVLSLTDRLLNGPDRVKLNGKESGGRDELQKGLDWLNNHFAINNSVVTGSDFFYYMWTIQMVGHYSGYRTFNGVDWYREATAKLLQLQKPDGTWDGPKGELLSTGFALLYLTRANTPLAISKVRFKGNWNNRPNDLVNFTEWASDEYEAPISWQIVDADLPVHEQVASRMLYLTSNDSFKLSIKEIAGLRGYLEAGGMLVLAPEGSGAERGRFNESAHVLGKALLGKDAFTTLANDHWIYNMHNPLSKGVKLSVMDNGVRPQIVLLHDDVSGDLQSNDRGKLNSFHALSNLYLAAVGQRFDRPRLATHYLHQTRAEPRIGSTVAHLSHSGNWNPEPHAMRQLRVLMANDHNVKLTVTSQGAAKLRPNQKFAFLSTVGDASLSQGEIEALRRWVYAGGTLWVDAAGGSSKAASNAMELVSQIIPDQRPTPIPNNDPVITGAGLVGGTNNSVVNYRNLVVQRFGKINAARLMTVKIDGRPAVILSGDDVTAGLAGLEHWGIYGYSPTSARQLVANALLTTIGAKDAVKVAAAKKKAEAAKAAAAKAAAAKKGAGAKKAPAKKAGAKK